MDLIERFYQTFIYDARYEYFLDGLETTVWLTIGSFVLGSLFGVLFCLLKRSKNKVVSKITELIIAFLVQLPTMVMLMVFVYVIFGTSGLSILIIVTFGLTLKAAAYLTEIFETAVNAVAVGEIEAARTLGMTKYQAFWYIVLPQAIKAGLPVYKNQLITTMQETSVVGYLAIMDLTRASSVVTARTLDAMFSLIAISIIYIILGAIGQKLLDLLENKKHLGGETA